MRLKQLDILRAVAVLLVLGRHYPMLQWWLLGGWIGVELFFVLSGFLIAGLLFSEFKAHSRIRVGQFLIRRGFKIYPPFYVLIAWTLGMFLLWRRPVPWPRFLSEVFFVQNYWGQLWEPTWSLAVEEHFYLALPLLLVLLARVSRNRTDPFRSLPGIFVAVAIAVLGARLWICWPSPEPVWYTLYRTTYHIDTLLFGVLISYFFHFRPAVFQSLAQWRRPWAAVVSALCIAPCFFLRSTDSYFIQTAEHVLLYLAFGWIVILAVTRLDTGAGKAAGVFRAAGDWLAYVGRHSYSIYLWHGPVLAWGLEILHRRHLLPEALFWRSFIYIFGSLVVGITMSKIVEIPSLRIREKFFPSRSGQPARETRAELFPTALNPAEAGPVTP